MIKINGTHLFDYRDRKLLTQKELSDLSGIGRARLSQIESSENIMVTLPTLKKILTHTDIDRKIICQVEST